jgi:hypothetical protein
VIYRGAILEEYTGCFRRPQGLIFEVWPEKLGRQSSRAITPERSALEPSTLDPSTLEPSTLEPSTLDPSTLDPSTLEPSTLEPSTLEPSTLEPSTPSIPRWSLAKELVLNTLEGSSCRHTQGSSWKRGRRTMTERLTGRAWLEDWPEEAWPQEHDRKTAAGRASLEQHGRNSMAGEAWRVRAGPEDHGGQSIT